MDRTDVSEALQSTFSKMSENSIKVWTSCIMRFAKEAKGSETFARSYLTGQTSVTAFLKTLNSNTKKTMCNALWKGSQVWGSDKLQTVYEKRYKRVAKVVDKANKQRKPTTNEKEQFKTWTDILSMKNELKSTYLTSKRNYLRYLSYLLYTEIPPLRPGEYATMKITKDDKESNYADLKNKKFIIRKQKVKSLPTRKIKMTKDLVEALESHVVIFGDVEWFLPLLKDVSRPQSTSSLSQFISNIFGMKPSMLRKVFISHHVNNSSARTVQRNATIMGHSIDRAINSYAVFRDSK